MYKRGDIIKIACKDLLPGTIFKYISNCDEKYDSMRSNRLFVIHESISSGKNYYALCIDDGNSSRSITNITYEMNIEIIRYGPKQNI